MRRSLPRGLRLWLCIVCIIIPALTSAQETEGTSGQWGPWTSWSVCSKTCGSGLAYRIRHCHRASTDGAECPGPHKQHHVCNRQVCSPDAMEEDYRTVECRKHNDNYYRGRRYHWEAFINPYARCELACKARGHRYYARFQKTVEDGTRCKHDVDAICLAGKCLDVGCDGILGSGAIVDQCGICGGDGSTCRVISGIFTRIRLAQFGYHHVTTIPTGACNINITELARSRNYLALTTSKGDNILNGNGQLRPLGQYDGAGTTFDYRRRSGRSCPGACVFADGPLTEPVEVQLLYYDRNPGIMYHFTVPQDTAAAVMSAANSTHNRLHHRHQQPPRPQHHPHRRTDRRPAEGKKEDKAINSQPSISIKHTSSPKRTRTPHRERHKKPDDKKLGSLSLASAPDVTTASLRDAPSFRREPLAPSSISRRPQRQQHHHRRRRPALSAGSAAAAAAPESPNQPRPSVIPRQASAPRYVPPEQEGAPIEYRHYYHVDPNDHRSLQHTAGFSGLDSTVGSRLARNEVLGAGGGGGGGGAEALLKPNIIPATRHTRRRWGAVGAGDNVIDNSVSAVGGVPLSVPASGYFVWAISGFSSCSEPCGGGTQQTVVVCMKSDTRVVVMAENCDINARPTSTTVACNTQPCEARWTKQAWSECSVTCGHGVQTRTVECQQRISPTLHLSVSADRCTDRKPPVTQFCRRPPCFQWKLSNWTKCSTHCGLGERTRMTSCVNGEGEVVPDSRCTLGRPKTREICDMGSCARGWYYTRWSKDCSPECGGKTHKTRKVYCAAEDGGTLPGDRCPADQRPRTRRACGTAKPCGGKWFSGPWSECNSTCGEAWRSRDVICMKKHGRRLWGVVGKENCLRKERPPARELCAHLPPCLPEWYMTHWSQCSKPCGTGSKTREVKCLDSALQPSLHCNAKRRPQERRACNKHSCDDHRHDVLDYDGDLASSSRRRHVNDYDSRPLEPRPPQRLQESTSANITFDSYHRDGRARQPLALKTALAPAEISLQQDFRSAMGDHDDPSYSRHHRRRHQHHQHRQYPDSQQQTRQRHHQSRYNHRDKEDDDDDDRAEGTGLATRRRNEAEEEEEEVVEEGCTDRPNSRWCLFVSQARLCGYGHYKRRCCLTCSKYNLHH